MRISAGSAGDRREFILPCFSKYRDLQAHRGLEFAGQLRVGWYVLLEAREFAVAPRAAGGFIISTGSDWENAGLGDIFLRFLRTQGASRGTRFDEVEERTELWYLVLAVDFTILQFYLDTLC